MTPGNLRLEKFLRTTKATRKEYAFICFIINVPTFILLAHNLKFR